MPPQNTQYTKLPGAGNVREGSSFFTLTHKRCTLWLGNDHLLEVESEGGYTEAYKRFYFQDIQGLILRITDVWRIATFTFGTLLFLFAAVGFLVDNRAGKITLYSIAGFWSVILLIHLAMGRTCACYIKTAVHFEELPSLRRLRRARKVLGALKGSIEQIQGPVSQDMLEPQYNALLTRSQAMAAESRAISSVSSQAVYRGRFHLILSWLLLADGCGTALNIFFPSVPLVSFEALASLGQTAALVMCLIHRNETSKPLIRWGWIATGFTVISYISSYAVMGVVLNLNEQQTDVQWQYLRALGRIDPLNTPWWLAILISFGSVSFVLGFIGLFLVSKHRKTIKTIEVDSTSSQPPPAPPPSLPPTPADVKPHSDN